MINRNRKNNFSLIELISVLAITGIFLGLALPSMDTILRGQSTEQAAINFSSVLNAVRSYAISNRKYVALIIPSKDSNLPDEYKNSYENKSYRPCVVDRSMNFMYWVRDNKWEFLPTSSAIIDIDNNTKYDLGSFTEATSIVDVNFNNDPYSLKGIVFKPCGLSLNQDDTFVVIGNINILDGKAVAHNQIDIKIDQYSGRISYGNN